MKLLMDAGVQQTTRDDCGKTSLHVAAYSNQSDAVSVLLQHKVSI